MHKCIRGINGLARGLSGRVCQTLMTGCVAACVTAASWHVEPVHAQPDWTLRTKRVLRATCIQ